ncbi:hypothetical protein K402DRAFT_448908 [Aulographum hederae CBS 113979]|uniref:Uncharacterized protein n=1 Tax=Aulographum hederae CBS 113979 TaxID=1176131 RepID=A0A6G1GML9_9PEZI|nr:hypothetical protein K402DRAFT_448908 [Aulographum hederae CBS 113979]
MNDPLHLVSRDTLPFPPGANASDTLFTTAHFSTNVLLTHNYTLYTNLTLSNETKCYLAFAPYITRTVLLPNGTFLNSTDCYVPLHSIRSRGYTGIGFAVLFATAIMLALICLKKHGQRFLREEKRFRAVGRRWTWYWMLFVAACGLISCVTGVDVDRYYVQGMPVILQSFFYTLMVPGTLAMVWEGVRHWGSWQERQIVDHSPYALPQDDRRGKTEFYLPLVFYLFAWLTFFLTIPRSWTPIQKQRSTSQTALVAAPAATDARFKAGAVLSVAAYIVICYSLWHSIKHYRRQPRREGAGEGTGEGVEGVKIFFRESPKIWLSSLLLLAIRLAYGIASSFSFHISLLNVSVNPGWPYGLGYGATVLLMGAIIVGGFGERNEDLQLMEQKRERGIRDDEELGVVRKPGWWRKGRGDALLDDEGRLRAMIGEVGVAKRGSNVEAELEMGEMGVREGGSAVHSQDARIGDPDPFTDATPASTPESLPRERPTSQTQSIRSMLFPENEEPFRDLPDGPKEAETVNTPRSEMGSSRTERSSQRIRSMLDV